MTRHQIGSDIQFLMEENALIVDGIRHKLEPRLNGLLALLVQKDGKTVSRDEILETVWDEGISDHALTQAVSRLRALCAPRPIIETVPRIGYRLSSVPHALTEIIELEPVSPAGSTTDDISPSRRGRRTRMIAAIIAAILAVAAIFYFGFYDEIRGLWCGACLPSD